MYSIGDIVVFLAGVGSNNELREGEVVAAQELDIVIDGKHEWLYSLQDADTRELFDRRSRDVYGVLHKPPKMAAVASTEKMSRGSILDEARDIVHHDRNVSYDSPERNFAHIADLWNSHFGTSFKPHEVATAMILVKVARTRTSPGKKDSWVDIAGYAACGGECAEEELSTSEVG